MQRTRIALIAVGAALAPASSAFGALSTPGPGPIFGGGTPTFYQGTSLSFSWGASTASGTSTLTGYIVSVADLTAGTPAGGTTTAAGVRTVTLTPASTPPIVDGHRYQIAILAQGTRTIPIPLLPPLVVPDFSDPTTPVTTTMDATVPTGTLKVNNGAAATNSRDVTLNLDASDPAPAAGLTPSGVDGFQVSQGASFPCSIIIIGGGGDTSGCTRAFAPTSPLQLADGPDGVRSVNVKFRDKSGLPGLILFGSPTGNESPVVTDTILLDRQPPTAKAVIGAGTIAVGSAISLSGSTSVDGISDPTKDSGIDPTSYQWQFGDGTIAAGAAVTKTYSAAGTFVGTLTVKDIAGNSNTANFQVVVPALPTGASTGGTTPGGTTGGSTTGGTPRVKKFAFGKILAGGLRFGKAGTVSLTVNKKTTVKVVLRRAGKSKVVRSVSRTGGPGVVKVTFVAPAAGSYTLVATASGTSKTIKVVVKP